MTGTIASFVTAKPQTKTMPTQLSPFKTHYRTLALVLGLVASSTSACSGSGEGGSTPSDVTGGSSFTSVVGVTGGVTQSGGNSSVAATTVVSAGGNTQSAGSTVATSGGRTGQGGTSASGGSTGATGGTSNASGGSTKATGGSSASTGGTKSTGGASATGGTTNTGGSKSTGGTSGNGGSSQYLPCPTNGDACIILPFGDSITDGVGSTDSAGYRVPLFKLVVAANQKINFVGSRSSGPSTVSGKTFPKNHEGHPGWTIDSGYVSYGEGISTLIPSPAFNTVPHIVLLMIGTNDVNSSKGTDTIAERLDVLLGKIIAVAPKALVVVAQATPIRWNPAALSPYNAKIPALIQKRAANGQHIVSVDMSKMPTTALASDGIHPNDTGYSYMADVWYAAIKGYLPK